MNQNETITTTREGDLIRISFRYDAELVAAVKELPGRKFDWETKTWTVPAEHEEEVQKFVQKHQKPVLTPAEILAHLKTAEGEAVDQPDLPKSWNHYKKEYAAILTINEEGKMDRQFLGTRTNFTGSRKNAEIEYDNGDYALMEEEGTVLEVRKGSLKHCDTSYYRKDADGWKFLGEREGTSNFFGGGRERMEVLVRR